MIVYKEDIINLLLEAGYNTGRIRKDRLLSESTLQTLRTSNNKPKDMKMIGMSSLNQICHLLKLQPGDIIEFVDESATIE